MAAVVQDRRTKAVVGDPGGPSCAPTGPPPRRDSDVGKHTLLTTRLEECIYLPTPTLLQTKSPVQSQDILKDGKAALTEGGCPSRDYQRPAWRKHSKTITVTTFL